MMGGVLNPRRMIVIRRLLIAGLAGLLIFYHGYTVSELRSGHHVLNGFEYVQIALKCTIAVSLFLVIANVRLGLLGMWLGVLALIGTQYYAHFGFQTAEFTDGRSPFSYLRGLIIPFVITVMIPKRSKRPKRPKREM